MTTSRPGHRWKKGETGNPGGRPKETVEVRALARQHMAEAITTLVTIMRKGDSDKVRAMAANFLLDRAVGKPPQALEIGGEGGHPLTVQVYLPENARH